MISEQPRIQTKAPVRPKSANWKFSLVGIFFGIVFVKAEVISWFRIQEMFRLDSFHMYGVIGTAVLVGMISLQLIKRFNIKTVQGDPISVAPKQFSKGQIYGGLLFGFGWAITGACPGPLFAQIGAGYSVVAVTLLSAIAGTWVYGAIQRKLPH
ncbi:MAG: YeeE/YedE family protein [Spirosoma sp.]|nr:YeeE/YedE family protein [Spirosoma sp.]